MILDKYRDEYEKSPYAVPTPHSQRGMTLWFNKELDDRVEVLMSEMQFYRSKGVYYGDLRKSHEEDLNRVMDEWCRWNANETMWVMIAVVIIGLVIFIILFDFIVGLVIGGLCLIPFLGQALADGGDIS